jgi:hypothetical protein
VDKPKAFESSSGSELCDRLGGAEFFFGPQKVIAGVEEHRKFEWLV